MTSVRVHGENENEGCKMREQFPGVKNERVSVCAEALAIIYLTICQVNCPQAGPASDKDAPVCVDRR